MFGKKTTAEDVLKMFETLSDDEKKKVMDAVKPTTEEQIEKAETDMAETGEDSQTEKDRIDESVAEQEKEDGDEDSQTAKDRVDESEGMEKAEEEEETEEPKQNSDVMQALVARITAIEEKLSDFEASLADKVSKDHNQDFGSNPSMPKGKEEGKRIADIMYSYAGDNARKYY